MLKFKRLHIKHSFSRGLKGMTIFRNLKSCYYIQRVAPYSIFQRNVVFIIIVIQKEVGMSIIAEIKGVSNKAVERFVN